MNARPILSLIDDDELIVESMHQIAESMGCELARFPTSAQFLGDLETRATAGPRCLVCELRTSGMDAIELQAHLRAARHGLPMIIVTNYATTRSTVRAMQAGARHVLDKPCGTDELWDAIRAALSWSEKTRRSYQEQVEMRARLATLTSNENRVLQAMLSGSPNKTIAKSLGISTRTVESRRHSIFKKTDTQSLAQLVAAVVRARQSASMDGHTLGAAFDETQDRGNRARRQDVVRQIAVAQYP